MNAESDRDGRAMRRELVAAWESYRETVAGPRRRRDRRRAQERAGRALVSAARSQAEFDELAARITGLDGKGQVVPPTMALLGDVVLPYVWHHRSDPDVVGWAVRHRDLSLLWTSGFFEEFADDDPIGNDPLTGALLYAATRTGDEAVWEMLVDRLVREIGFYLLDFSCAGPDRVRRAGVEHAVWRLAQLLLLLERAPAGVVSESLRDAVDQQRAAAASWARYDAAGSIGDFRSWFESDR